MKKNKNGNKRNNNSVFLSKVGVDPVRYHFQSTLTSAAFKSTDPFYLNGLTVFGFSFVFHDKSKRTQQGDLLECIPWDIILSPLWSMLVDWLLNLLYLDFHLCSITKLKEHSIEICKSASREISFQVHSDLCRTDPCLPLHDQDCIWLSSVLCCWQKIATIQDYLFFSLKVCT